MNKLLGLAFVLCILALGIVHDDRELPDGSVTDSR
jgi:hypothetical protein